MRRQLPCPKCGVAWLKDGKGNKIPYEIGVMPSAFSTRGREFTYACGCALPGKAMDAQRLKPKTMLKLSKAAFMALPDLDAPKEPTPIATGDLTPEEIQEGLARAQESEAARQAKRQDAPRSFPSEVARQGS